MTAFPTVANSMAVADPDIPANVVKPNSDGSINVKVIMMNVTQQSGTTYTFDIADAESFVQFTSGSATTVTIPANATVAFPIGTVIQAEADGTGAVTLQGAGGVTAHSLSGNLVISGQYGVATLTKVATNTWVISGDLTT